MSGGQKSSPKMSEIQTVGSNFGRRYVWATDRAVLFSRLVPVHCMPRSQQTCTFLAAFVVLVCACSVLKCFCSFLKCVVVFLYFFVVVRCLFYVLVDV